MSGQNADVLDYLRAQFARQDAQHEKTRNEVKELRDRVTVIETMLAAARRDTADIYVQVIAVGHQLQALTPRFEHIERRLDLVGTP